MRWFLLALPAVVFSWIALRHVFTRPLWRDESATLEFASLSFVDLARSVSHIDLVLAPYYALMHVVVLVSDGALAIRLPSVAAGLVSVVFISLAVRQRWGLAAGFVAGLFLATNAAFYETSTTGRPYALSAAALSVAAWLGARDDGRTPRPMGWIVALCCAVVMQPLSVLAAPGLALALCRKRSVRAVVGALLVPGGLAAALILVTRTQSSQVGWIKKLAFSTAFDQVQAAAMLRSWVPFVLVIVAAGVIQFRSRARSLDWLSWLVAFVLPPFALWAVTEVAVPLFVMRYAVMLLPALAGLVGASTGEVLSLVPRRAPLRALALPLAAFIAGVAVWGASGALHHTLSQRSSIDGTEKVARFVRTHARQGDGVVYVASRAAGGSIYGWARYEGDETLQKDLLAQLAQGRGATMQRRTVVSTEPYRTAPASGVGPHTWIVGSSSSTWQAALPSSKRCRHLATHQPTRGTSVIEVACS